jgi:hypothetical protein
VTRTAPDEPLERRPFDARVAWLAVALWTLAAMVGVLVLLLRIRTPPPAVPARETAPVGVANRMPDAVPAQAPAASAPSSSTPPPTEAPAPSEHVYTVEELPLAAPARRPAHAVPPGRAQVGAPGRSPADDGF